MVSRCDFWHRDCLRRTADRAEKRHNGRVAREFQVNLPSELPPLARLGLARAFAQEVAERYKVAVDLAVHAPRPEGDPRNFHAHLLATTREVTPTGLGAKTGLDMEARERRKRELPDHRQEFMNVRERWAILTNEALRAANIAARVDHRSLAAQGAEREPTPAIPIMHLKMERRGVRSEYAERLRAQYQERVAARAAQAPSITPPQRRSVTWMRSAARRGPRGCSCVRRRGRRSASPPRTSPSPRRISPITTLRAEHARG